VLCPPHVPHRRVIATLATVWAGGTHVIMPRFDPDMRSTSSNASGYAHAARSHHARRDHKRTVARPRNVSSLRYLSHGASPFRRDAEADQTGLPGARCCTCTHDRNDTDHHAAAHEERLLDTPLIRSCGQPAVASRCGSWTNPRLTWRRARSARSPCAAQRDGGYWQKPEKTAEVMRADWYLTGDLGYQDRPPTSTWSTGQDISSARQNIYSTEVENALATITRSRRSPLRRSGPDWERRSTRRIRPGAGDSGEWSRTAASGFAVQVPRCSSCAPSRCPSRQQARSSSATCAKPHWAGRKRKSQEASMRSTIELSATVSTSSSTRLQRDSEVVTNEATGAPHHVPALADRAEQWRPPAPPRVDQHRSPPSLEHPETPGGYSPFPAWRVITHQNIRLSRSRSLHHRHPDSVILADASLPRSSPRPAARGMTQDDQHLIVRPGRPGPNCRAHHYENSPAEHRIPVPRSKTAAAAIATPATPTSRRLVVSPPLDVLQLPGRAPDGPGSPARPPAPVVPMSTQRWGSLRRLARG